MYVCVCIHIYMCVHVCVDTIEVCITCVDYWWNKERLISLCSISLIYQSFLDCKLSFCANNFRHACFLVFYRIKMKMFSLSNKQ